MDEDEIQRLGEQLMEHVRACTDPREQYRMWMNVITWLDKKRVIPRNSKAGCLAKQARLLAGMKNAGPSPPKWSWETPSTVPCTSGTPQAFIPSARGWPR
jgi:hypothetical protein